MKKLALALPLVALLAVAYAQEAAPPTRDAVIARAQREVDAFRNSDLVVVGRLAEVHRSPGVWCGILATRQDVTFEVQAVLAGEGKPAEVRAGFLLVHGSPLVDEEPRLDPSKFRPGSRWLLCLQSGKEHCEIRDEAFGARLLESPPAAPAEQAAVLQAALPAVEAWLHQDEPGRIPLIVLANEFVSPPPVLFAAGQPVSILPKDRIGDRPYLEFTSVEVDGGAAKVGLSYPVEGVRSHVQLRRHDGTWFLARTSSIEK